MAWTTSEIFTSFITDKLNNATAMNLGSDQLEVCLFDNTITPSQTVASASTAYNAGIWTTGFQYSGTSWPQLGRPLATVTSTFASNVYKLGAANTSSADGTCTLSGTYGCLIYDNTIATPVAKQGICFNYFGGAVTITSGTFTVAWNASGIFTLTL